MSTKLDLDSTPVTGAAIVADPEAAHLVDELLRRVEQLHIALDDQRTATEGVYCQRAHILAVVTGLLALVPGAEQAVLARNGETDPEFPVLYIQLPDNSTLGKGERQICYHIHPADLPLFDRVETVPGDDPRAVWDRGDKREYHRRISTFAGAPAVRRSEPPAAAAAPASPQRRGEHDA